MLPIGLLLKDRICSISSFTFMMRHGYLYVEKYSFQIQVFLIQIPGFSDTDTNKLRMCVHLLSIVYN